MQLTLTIDMDNAAFDGDEYALDELRRIFREYADQIDAGWYAGPRDLASTVHDVNGNSVGTLTITDRP